MNKINLNDITIENFPDTPTEIRVDEEKRKCWHDYKVLGSLGDKNVGLIKLSLAVEYPTRYIADFWHNLDSTPTAIRPVVIYQETNKDFYGQGISGKIITLANEIAKVRFNSPLASDTLFCHNIESNWDIFDFAERPSQRVWEKLERDKLAYRRDYNNKPRWVMF